MDNAVFTALVTEGTLSAGFFRASSTGVAADGNDPILYNTSTGALAYDADGNGSISATVFAVLNGLPAVTAADFVVN